MRRWWLAALPLFWSCADNLAEHDAVMPALADVDVPQLVVAGWHEALVIRAKAQLPDESGDGWTVGLRVAGPGLDAPLDYLLLDDGDHLVLSDPGPGQEAHSGDNVPGDGWHTMRLSADFSAGLGDFTFRLRLLENGQERDFRQVVRARVENRAPAILAVEAPAVLPSGGSFTATLTAADPDGQEDLVMPQLRQSGGVMRSWGFVPTGDSTWTVTAGPELAAARQGPDTLHVVVVDRVGHETTHPLVVELLNGAPSLDEDGLEHWIWNFGEGRWDPVALLDTLFFQLPAADTNLFQISLPVRDPQTLADVAGAEWSIARDTVAFEDLQWFALDDLGPAAGNGDFTAGDGRFSGAMVLPAGMAIVPRTLRIRAVDRVGQESALLSRPVALLPPPAGQRSRTPAGGVPRHITPRGRIQ